MVEEAPTPYRYGVWGGLTPAQRHRLDATLDQPPVGEYLGRLEAALEAAQAAQAAQVARGATDAA